ncbi:helix-turn-helix domain-containing protein [Leisingera daeponensis]|uniref:helix-turn-helix domain-containing protein n=1 Tax=Leisingera daeponensis TaxID=405746 RepID=UPI001C9816AA|nr:helix-turn-helix domain-containing protein [Leisingera daeponensis]MBY6055405.1 helix-turn-helix domain-containing protein [Leisingera daeponensis]
MQEPQSTIEGDQNRRPIFADWYTRKELAAELSLSVDTLSRWSSQGRGPVCINAGNRIMYSREAVEAWLREEERRAEARFAK